MNSSVWQKETENAACKVNNESSDSNADDFTESVSQRGKPKLVEDGYSYTISRVFSEKSEKLYIIVITYNILLLTTNYVLYPVCKVAKFQQKRF